VPESACRWPQVFHTPAIRLRPMTLFNPVFNRQTPKGLNRLMTQADEGLTTADEAGYVVLRQPPASELANLFRINAWDHALGLVTPAIARGWGASGGFHPRLILPAREGTSLWKSRPPSC